MKTAHCLVWAARRFHVRLEYSNAIAEEEAPMPNEYSPLVSEFDSAEHEARYTAWLQAKVAKALADPRPPIPHDEVMAEMEALIREMEARLQKR